MVERLRIEAVLDRIRPLLRADGLDVVLIDVRRDGATVHFSGVDHACSSAPLMLHTGLSEALREEIPGFGELRVV